MEAMDTDLTVDLWLESFPREHPRAGTLRRFRSTIAKLLNLVPPTDRAQVLQVLSDHKIAVKSIRDFLEEGYSVAEIAMAAEIRSESKTDEDEEFGDWGLMHAYSIRLARAFHDDQAGDIFSLLLRYRTYVQLTTRGKHTPRLGQAADALLEFAEAGDYQTVGDVLEDLEPMIEEADSQWSSLISERSSKEALWRRPQPRDLEEAYGGYEDDDLGDD
jgi:hypothetical protein